jgi:hypothetical protein
VPLWAIILSLSLASVPGLAGLLVAALNMGAIRRDVHDLVQRAVGWDTKIADVQKDTAYIRGRLDGRQEGLDEVAPTPRRRSRAALAAVKSS